MNFVEGRIEYKDDNAYFVFGSHSILLPALIRNALANYKDQRVIFGIRPEHVSLQPIPGQTQNTITGTIKVIEPLGEQADVCLEIGIDAKMIARVPAESDIQVGQPIIVYVYAEKAHVFERGRAGNNISLMVR